MKNVDFESGEILIRDGKGVKDRVIMSPDSFVTHILDHLQVTEF